MAAFTDPEADDPPSATREARPAALAAPGLAVMAALFGLAYLAVALLGHALVLRPSEIATFRPAAGLYLAALVLAAPRRWPALVAAATAANLASAHRIHADSTLSGLLREMRL